MILPGRGIGAARRTVAGSSEAASSAPASASACTRARASRMAPNPGSRARTVARSSRSISSDRLSGASSASMERGRNRPLASTTATRRLWGSAPSPPGGLMVTSRIGGPPNWPSQPIALAQCAARPHSPTGPAPRPPPPAARPTLTATPRADSVRGPAAPRSGQSAAKVEVGVETKKARARIADVAAESGVSKAAVSFAFNSPERLNSATAARIRAVADALGYKPRSLAGVATRTTSDGATIRATQTIGLLTPQVLSVAFANPFYAEFCAGVAAQTDQAGYGLLFVSPLHGSLVRAIGRAPVDGFVVVGLSEDHPEVEQIRRAGLAMVIVDGGALPEHGLVQSNDEVGARSAAPI